MAKTIKFNLILDNQSVRTIEDLRENFSIEDVLEVYNNGLLQRWLEVRGYSEILEKINDIAYDSNIDIIKRLINIFKIEIKNEKVEEGVEILEYINKRKIKLQEYNELNFKTQKIIEDYHLEYQNLIEDIIENKDDMSKIKANIKQFEDIYFELFKCTFHKLYYRLKENAPLAVFAIV